MTNGDKNELNKIEDVKKKIFSRSYETKINDRKDFSISKKGDIKDVWEHEEGEKENLSKNKLIYKKFFIISIFLFLLSLGYLVYNFYFKDNSFSNDNIDISILGNTYTNGGEEMPLLIEINNKNDVNLELVDLVIEYPKGSTLKNNLEVERTRQSLGTILADSVKSEKIKIKLFGEKDSLYEIKVIIEYRLEGSTAVFVKEKPYKITINSTPINFVIESPSDVIPNQELTFKVKTILNDTKSIPNLLLKLDYPIGFEFTSAEPSPVLNNNIWDFSNLLPGEEKEITITGKMSDVYDGEEKVFYIYSGVQKADDKFEIGVIFNSFAHSILIKKPFFGASLSINGDYKNEYSVNTKEQIKGSINWINNLNTPLNDIIIKAKFSGNVLNVRGISSDTGFYNSLDNTITWDKNTIKEFSEVRPLQKGNLSFILSPLSPMSSPNEFIKAPSLNVEISVFAKQNISGSMQEKLENIENKTIKLISDVSLLNKLEHSTSLPIIDIGPYPPKVEKETTYTITWALGNTFNNVSKVKVSSFLESRVDFKNIISPENEDITYNPATKEIIWNVGNLPKGTGIKTKNKEVSFQVSYIPSLSEVGKNIILTKPVILNGYDEFTKSNIRVTGEILKIESRIVE